MDELKKNLDIYLKIDSDLERINKVHKKKKEEKANVEKYILQLLEKNNLQNTKINLTNCSLKYKVNETMQPLTIEFLKNSLKKYFKTDPEKLIKFIQTERSLNKKKTIGLKKLHKRSKKK